MSKNRNICKVGLVRNGKNYKNSANSNTTEILDIDTLSGCHIKEEKINLIDDVLCTKGVSYGASCVKVEINEDFISEGLAAVPSKYKEVVSLQSTSSASSPGSDRSVSPVNSHLTLNLPYEATEGTSPSIITSEVLSKPIYLTGSSNPEKSNVSSSSQPLQQYVLINSPSYQMIVPSHGVPHTTQQGSLQRQLGRPIQLHLMGKPNNLPVKLNTVITSYKSKQNARKFDVSKLNHHREGQRSGSLRKINSEVAANGEYSTHNYDDDDDLPRNGHVNKNSNILPQENLEDMESNFLEMVNPSISQENLSQGSDSECSIPNLLNDSGQYGFKVYLDDKKDTLKTPTWLMSDITKKLYTNMNKPVPFRVILKKMQNFRKKFQLRAMAVFKYPMFLRHNVVRCPHHLNPLDPSNADFPEHLNHVVRADHPRAIYESSQSGRLSVIVPLDFPENRKEAVPVLLKFMCHNSCVGGISRRPLAVLLTLELNGEELGRSIIDVRVCACPSRDVRSEEKQVISRGLYKKTISHTFVGRRARKRQRPDEIPNLYDEQDEILFIPVRGINLYNYLIEMKSLYLKHHADYADKYPDPPIEYRPMDESANFNETLDSHSGANISANSEETILAQSFRSSTGEENSEPIYLTSRNDDEQTHYVLQSDLQDALMSDDSGDNSDSGHQISFVESENQKTLTEKDHSPSCHEDNNEHHNGYHYNTQASDNEHSSNYKQYSNIDAVASSSCSNSKISSSSKSSFSKPTNRRFHKNRSSLSNHIQVCPMPNKNKGVLPKSYSSDNSEYHSGDNTNDESNSSFDKINESEKVMLAAQVLASHLGSQSIEVNK